VGWQGGRGVGALGRGFVWGSGGLGVGGLGWGGCGVVVGVFGGLRRVVVGGGVGGGGCWVWGGGGVFVGRGVGKTGFVGAVGGGVGGGGGGCVGGGGVGFFCFGVFVGGRGGGVGGGWGGRGVGCGYLFMPFGAHLEFLLLPSHMSSFMLTESASGVAFGHANDLLGQNAASDNIAPSRSFACFKPEFFSRVGVKPHEERSTSVPANNVPV